MIPRRRRPQEQTRSLRVTRLTDQRTRSLLGNLFEYRDLNAVDIKGFPDPIKIWQVLRPSAVESRFEALRTVRLTPLVGRDGEIELLMRRWLRAKEGEGQVVLLAGEPGVGKSRVAAAISERLGSEPHRRLRYFCSPQHRDSPLYPFIAHLERAADFTRDDPPELKLKKLDALLARSGESPAGTAALFADLLGLAAESRYPPPPDDPQQRRDLTFAAMLDQLRGLARRKPVLLIVEDGHWLDSTSLDMCFHAPASCSMKMPRSRSTSPFSTACGGFTMSRAEHSAAWEVSQQCLALAERHRHDEAAALGHYILGDTLWATGGAPAPSAVGNAPIRVGSHERSGLELFDDLVTGSGASSRGRPN